MKIKALTIVDIFNNAAQYNLVIDKLSKLSKVDFIFSFAKILCVKSFKMSSEMSNRLADSIFFIYCLFFLTEFVPVFISITSEPNYTVHCLYVGACQT